MVKTGLKAALVVVSALMSTLPAVAPPAGQAAVLYVSPSGSEIDLQAQPVFPGIQAAVDDAAPGERVLVPSGTYTENVTIDKPLTLVSQNGHAVTTVIAANPGKSVFTITAVNVTLSGFTAYGATGSAVAGGVYLTSDSGNCTITDNRFGTSPAQNNGLGIFIYESGGHTISQNDCRYNLYAGIDATRSSGNVITANDCSYNDAAGISISDSDGSLLGGNECRYNGENGIILYRPANTIVTENEAKYNSLDGIGLIGYDDLPAAGNRLTGNIVSNNDGDGIYIGKGTGNLLKGNACKHNGESGIVLFRPTHTVIAENEAQYNLDGIQLTGTDESPASGNLLLRNSVVDNDEKGIYILDGTDNRTIMNTIQMNGGTGLSVYKGGGNRCWLNGLLSNSTRQVNPGRTSNQWAGPALVWYTYNGFLRTQSLGNYYDDHDPSDANADGVADAAYDLLADGDPAYDWFPLATPPTDTAWGWEVSSHFEKIIASGFDLQVVSKLTIVSGRVTISGAVLTIGI